MMDWQRTALLIAMAAVALLLVIEWNEFQEAHRPALDTTTTLSPTTTSDVVDAPTEPAASPSDDVPTLPSEAPAQQPAAGVANAQLVDVYTDVLQLKIDTHGGDIVMVALPDHPIALDQPNNPLVLLNRTNSSVYVAQSGLVGRNGTDASGERPVFSVQKREYRLADGQDVLQVDLQLQQEQTQITKSYIFRRGDYLVDVQYRINNQSGEEWSAHFYGQIKRDDHEPPKTGPAFGIRSYLGAAITTPDDNYQRITFDEIQDQNQSMEIQGGWIAMLQHYFISAWVPPQDQSNSYFLNQLGNQNVYLMGFRGPRNTVAPGEQGTIGARFYVGPKDIDRLEEIAPHLAKTIDYGWLWWISLPLFHFLDFIHTYLGNWGWAIVVLTLSVKLAFFHFSAAGYRGMAKMRNLAPKMAELKERYGDNKQKFSEEMMKLYKKEGANPFSSCLPLLLQMPVFLALYYVLMESVELRHAPWILWIEDLSNKDPYFILPLLYGFVMWLQQKLNPQPADPTQARIMQMMPIMFTVMFLFFPSGLVLYWVVNALLGIAQQYVITKQIENANGKAA